MLLPSDSFFGWIKKQIQKQKKRIEIGDWVKSYSKGIYRVEKIFDRFYDESSPLIPEKNKIGDQENSIVLSKRFLNSKFKKSISYENCDESFISQLTVKEQMELNKVISEKPKLVSELDEYEIPTGFKRVFEGQKI